MGTRQNNILEEEVEKYNAMLMQAKRCGLAEGYGAGYDDGFNDCKEDVKPAVSDGLRHGSSECGRYMNKYK